jgi:hypothetical protein
MPEYPILTVLLMMGVGLVGFIVSLISIGVISSGMSFYFAAPLITFVYVLLLAIGIKYWPPLGIIATFSLWGFAGLLEVNSWLINRKRQKQSIRKESEGA